MKVALCISGLPRKFADAYPYVRRNILDPWQPDVFVHTWAVDGAEEAIDLYRATASQVDQPLNPAYAQRYPYSASLEFCVGTVSQFYSLYAANQLKQREEINSNSIYDVVIRTRFDLAVNIELPLRRVRQDDIWVPNDLDNRWKESLLPNYFAFGSSFAMNLYSSTWTHLDYLYRNGTMMNGEQMCWATLALYNWTGNLHSIDMNPPFPPNGRDNIWHSYVR